MSDKEIKEMLQKYMDGMTSVEEETRLAKYFSKAGNKAAPEGIADADWQAYKEMFAMFAPKRRKAAVVKLWRWAAAAAVLLLVVLGSRVWFDRPVSSTMPDDKRVAVVDSTASEVVPDTMELGGAPQEKTPVVKKRKKQPVRQRHEPTVPRHYMAQAAPASEEVDPEEALRQADLLMQAVYLQQQSDLNDAMMQCTLVIEEEEEVF